MKLKKSICNEDDDIKNSKIIDIQKGTKKDSFIQRTIYEDGSTTVYWGGPCGSSNYDEFGEEC